MIKKLQVASKDKCKRERASLRLELERGVKDGDVLNFPHMAEQSPGMLPGFNLLYFYTILEIFTFTRDLLLIYLF